MILFRFKIIIYIFLYLSFVSYSLAENHPIFNPRGDVYALKSALESRLTMSDTQLEALIDATGKVNNSNIDTVQVVYDLGLLYHLTGTPDYAHRAAVLLERYAAVFNSWPKEYCDGFCGIWTYWFQEDMDVSYKLAVAFDLIYQSGQVNTTTVTTFLNSVVKADLGYKLYSANASYMRGQGLVAFGRVLNQPKLVHLGLYFFNRILHEYYTSDGFISEGAYSYHAMLTKKIIESPLWLLDGWVDPAEYSHTPYHADLDPAVSVPISVNTVYGPAFSRMTATLEETAYPNTELPILNDTWYFEDGNSGRAGTPPTESTLLPGIGHAILVHGTGSAQTQARLEFSPARSHAHQDTNQLLFWDKGKEVVGGTGYKGGNRAWNSVVFNQNLVSVDNTQQKQAYWLYYDKVDYNDGHPLLTSGKTDLDYLNLTTTNHHNNLTLWEPGYKGDTSVQVMEVDASDAYRDNVSLYRRFIGLINVDGTDTYLLDFFRIKGGSIYRWQLHGGHTWYSAEASLNLSPVAGSIGAGSWLGIDFDGVERLVKGSTDQSWSATLTYSDSVKEKIYMLGDTDTDVYMGHGQGEPAYPETAYFEQEYILAERERFSSETVSFLAAHNVFTGASSRISSIAPLAFEGDAGTAVGMAITLDNGMVDFVIHTLDDGPDYPEHIVTGHANFKIKGRFAHIRADGNTIIWMKLLQGSNLSFGARKMVSSSGDFSTRGTIQSVFRKEAGHNINAFSTNVDFLSDDIFIGKALIVKWGNGWTWGYTIKSITGNTIEVDEEPAFEIENDTVNMHYFPIGNFPGPVTFTIPGSAYMDSSGKVLSSKPSLIKLAQFEFVSVE